MTVPVGPILAALARHKAGVFVVALQIALTLAIVANAVFVITQRINFISRPSGIDEANIVVVDNRWAGAPTPTEVQAKTAADLAMLRGLSGVADAYADYSYPVAGPWATVWTLDLLPNQKAPTSYAEPYYADEHALGTYGVPLISGRNFRADEVSPGTTLTQPAGGPIIVTQDLARKLFPGQPGLGRAVYIAGAPRTIIGIISDMEVPAVGTRSFAYRSVLVPVRLADAGGDQYIVRAKPGEADLLKRTLATALYKVSRLRMIDPVEGVQTFHALRNKAYSRDRGLVILLTAACTTLLLATAGGIIGLTVFWVDERRRQIGLRRALGARRSDILTHILAENFFIVALGIGAGSILSLVANVSLMHYLAMPKLPAIYIALGSALILALGQGAALNPARRAARMSPMEAVRADA